MNAEPVIVVGAGPAGTSAALALADRGIAVHLLDAGTGGVRLPPAGNLLDARFGDAEQWRWQIGERGEGLATSAKASPKFRVPGMRPIFDGVNEHNHLQASPGFFLAGAAAAGGLSNAWGCGVARFDAAELGELADDATAMHDSYARAALRMGLSGASDDALQAYFGLDDWSAPALPLDSLHARLWQRRARTSHGLRLGRARVAVLSSPRAGRSACDLSGLCLWGCPGRATWSAALDAETLARDPRVRMESGAWVERLRQRDDGGWHVDALIDGQSRTFGARQVVLAAGTLATTRLALGALPDPPRSLRLQSNPMAAFLMTLPAAFGAPRERGFGLAQLSFALDGRRDEDGPGFGNLFSTAGIPVSEFLAHLPISRRAGLPLLRALLPSTLVGNFFLPGGLSDHRVVLGVDGGLRIDAGQSPDLAPALADAHRRITQAFRRMGGWLLPGSFVPGVAGADLHYAATLPIRRTPAAHECHLDGRLAGASNLYIVDGASLPTLPAKAHTLSLIANADRIARRLLPK